MTGLPDIFMAIWFLPLIGFILSFIITLIIVQTAPLHARFTADAHDGPQKIHQNITPRIGGVAMFVSMMIVGLLGMFDAHPISAAAIGAAVPVFLGGLLEDVTGRVSPRIRLLLAIISGACFMGAFMVFLLIMLPERNETVSPFVSLLLVIYPSYEMMRSTIRRLNKTAILNPNARAGFTMLIFPLFYQLLLRVVHDKN